MLTAKNAPAATSHQSGLGVEVKATSYEELSEKMDQVRFPLKPCHTSANLFIVLHSPPSDL